MGGVFRGPVGGGGGSASPASLYQLLTLQRLLEEDKSRRASREVDVLKRKEEIEALQRAEEQALFSQTVQDAFGVPTTKVGEIAHYAPRTRQMIQRPQIISPVSPIPTEGGLPTGVSLTVRPTTITDPQFRRQLAEHAGSEATTARERRGEEVERLGPVRGVSTPILRAAKIRAGGEFATSPADILSQEVEAQTKLSQAKSAEEASLITASERRVKEKTEPWLVSIKESEMKLKESQAALEAGKVKMQPDEWKRLQFQVQNEEAALNEKKRLAERDRRLDQAYQQWITATTPSERRKAGQAMLFYTPGGPSKLIDLDAANAARIAMGAKDYASLIQTFHAAIDKDPQRARDVVVSLNELTKAFAVIKASDTMEVWPFAPPEGMFGKGQWKPSTVPVDIGMRYLEDENSPSPSWQRDPTVLAFRVLIEHSYLQDRPDDLIAIVDRYPAPPEIVMAAKSIMLKIRDRVKGHVTTEPSAPITAPLISIEPGSLIDIIKRKIPSPTRTEEFGELLP